MQEYRIPPRMLLGSFGIVVSSYLAVLFGQLCCTILIAWLLFPKAFSGWTARPMSLDEIAADIDTLMPQGLFWIATGLTTLVCLGVGLLIARWARFAPVGHAIFSALLIAVSYLQFAAEKPSSMKWMALASMLAFPIAILLGCRLGLSSRAPTNLEGHSTE